MERTSAVPLPDPESALGTRITCYRNQEIYERIGLRVSDRTAWLSSSARSLAAKRRHIMGLPACNPDHAHLIEPKLSRASSLLRLHSSRSIQRLAEVNAST